MKIEEVRKYIFEDNTKVEFIKDNGCPGFTYRVVINNILTNAWSARPPSKHVALYFYDKIVRGLPPNECGNERIEKSK